MTLAAGRRLLALSTSTLLAACGPEAATSEAPGAGAGPPAAAVTFVDVTGESGVDFVHQTGAFGEKWLPETMGSGVVLFDADGDRRLDLLLLNGTRFEGRPGPASRQGFYLNRGGLRFVAAGVETGLDIEANCLAGAAADIDNDGDGDLYLSCLGTDRLLVNEGGRFVDRSAAAGLTRAYEFGASVAFLDADRDGWVDIFATRYVTWTPESDLFCTLDGLAKSYCTPESYPGASPRFYRNRGDGTFEDLTDRAGLRIETAKSLGVAVLDVEGDGWPDLAVASDTQPNLLFVNRGDGSFEEIGAAAGVAFSETGVARGGMGIDAADYERSGRPGLVIGNFANEMVALYRNLGDRLFADVAPADPIGRSTLLSLTFGAFFFDFDLDGWLDVLIANGHLDPEIEQFQPAVRYRQPAQLFVNRGDGSFAEADPTVAGDLLRARVARGAAYGDLDGDGDLDVVLTENGGPAAILENMGGHGNWLTVELEGRRSNRDGLGAVVTVRSRQGSQSWLVRTGSSYLSQSQLAPVFGLGTDETVDAVTVRWPSGEVSERTGVAAGQVLRIVEGE
jgi:hypothetical protein